ncbi:putative leucine-rich repeat-containing protein DDB_G0290503 [Benincasa hispida]|uniref:putative leucine-rich repeat-containing protein DDB_G0290503 n=1 Tax=Benincasa hispida TaxID=102211 RepID=UPI0019016B53|nr:putative leucine-rich repeat-containing protein DDB_G0290503 [Benincasa hispida]
MDSDDDLQLLSSPGLDSPLVSGRKLKRLKKASGFSQDLRNIDERFSSGLLGEFSRIDDRLDDGLKIRELSAVEPEAEDSDKLNGQDLDEFDEVQQSGSGSRDLDDGGNLGVSLGLDGEENDSRVEKGLEFDAVAGTDEKAEDQSLGMGAESGDALVDELEKKRPSLVAFEDEREAKRRKSKNKRLKSSGEPGDFNETALSKRTLEKERREYVQQLRAESQRLLRDTRGAAFKPMPLVQKPISSVLEKIRRRKLELSRKSINIGNTILDCDDEDDDNYQFTEVVIKHRLSVEGRADSVEKECENMDQHPADEDNQRDSMCIDERSNGINMPPEKERATDEVTETFRAPVNDTQELFSDSQTNNGDNVSNEMSKNLLQENFMPSVLATNLILESAPLDDVMNETSSSHLQENFTPSVLAMNLRLDSAALDEDSDEEDNDKENVNPHPHGLSDLPSSASGDPVKAFVDDEAEEEDDSDHDMRFQDDEEDEDTDLEELQDMIATAYEENPLDNEKRNELHQKWLEQQDAAGTEDLLQKLKYGSKPTKQSLLEDENNEGENDDFECCEDAAEDSLPLDVARMNIRKVKEMLPQMYTDKDDHYISDDDETDRKLARERVFDKADGKSTFLSPAEDESTREVFGLIKKLNVVPDVKKRRKAQLFSDSPLTGVGKNTSSKSSFLGRSSNLSLSSSHKHGSSANNRSFIFGRDDSNSRSAIPTMEETSDQGQSENNKATRISSAKFSYSQVRPSAQNTVPEIKSGSSLFDILRQSSLQLQRKPCTFGEESSQMSSAFASFKLEKTHMKKPIKTEGRF